MNFSLGLFLKNVYKLKFQGNMAKKNSFENFPSFSDQLN